MSRWTSWTGDAADRADTMFCLTRHQARGLLAVEPFGERGCQGTARQSSSVQRTWDRQGLVVCYFLPALSPVPVCQERTVRAGKQYATLGKGELRGKRGRRAEVKAQEVGGD